MKKAAVKKPTHVLALRTCKADGTSYNGFAWPESGSVECADWKKTAECGNDSGRASASGKQSIAAQIGYNGCAMAGEDGCIVVAWYDGKRPRVCVGYVGEDGIEAGAWYCVSNGKLVKP